MEEEAIKGATEKNNQKTARKIPENP